MPTNTDLRVCEPEDVYGRGPWASLGFYRPHLYRPKRKPGEWVGDYGRIMHRAPVVALRKVGRNDPCTCGSGRKFKKCCGAIAA